MRRLGHISIILTLCASPDQFPDSIDIITKVCNFYKAKLGLSTSLVQDHTKKRKVEHKASEDGYHLNMEAALTISNVSVSMPIRKKLDIILTENFLVARSSPTTPEFILDYSHDNVSAAFILDIPEKTKPQWNLVVVFMPSDTTEFKFFQVTLFEDTIKNTIKPTTGEQYSGSIKEMLLLYFQRRNIPIFSNETITPSEPLFHVTAYRGSKDGLLFFLPNHIFFGFKKPLLLYPLQSIISVSYSCITRSTFNVVIKFIDSSTSVPTDVEFSMIDQSLYEQINQYVTMKSLHNDSMAEKRKAKTDSKAQFPVELLKANQAATVQKAQDKKTVAENFSLSNFDDSDDDEDDEDFNSNAEEDEDSEGDADSNDSDSDGSSEMEEES